MGHIVRGIGIFVAFLFVLYLAAVVLWALWSVKRADREAYFICDRHGAIRSRDMLRIVDDGEGPPIELCPVCYTEKLKDARNRVEADAASIRVAYRNN